MTEARDSSWTVPVWLVRRALPMMLLALGVTLVAGLWRGWVLYLPGVAGMVVGGSLGYLFGRLARRDPDRMWTFSSRSGFTLGATLVYVAGSMAVAAAVHAGAAAYPIDWLFDVLNGSDGELFFGFSTNSYQSVSGLLNGAWWVVFVVVDGALFAFLHLIMMGVALTPDDESAKRVGDSVDDPAPLEPGSAPPLGTLALFVFLAGAIALVVGAAAWPELAVLAGAEAPVRVGLSELQGDWVFGEEASWFAGSEQGRHFTLANGLGDEIACYSADQGSFMIVLSPRRDGSFEGRLLLRGRGELPARMRAAPDLKRLHFTLRGVDRMGRVQEREATAERSGAAG